MLCPGIEAGIAEHPKQWCSTMVLRCLGTFLALGGQEEKFLFHLILGFSGSAKMRRLDSGLSLLPQDGVGGAPLCSQWQIRVCSWTTTELPQLLKIHPEGFNKSLSSKGGRGPLPYSCVHSHLLTDPLQWNAATETFCFCFPGNCILWCRWKENSKRILHLWGIWGEL